MNTERGGGIAVDVVTKPHRHLCKRGSQQDKTPVLLCYKSPFASRFYTVQWKKGKVSVMMGNLYSVIL